MQVLMLVGLMCLLLLLLLGRGGDASVRLGVFVLRWAFGVLGFFFWFYTLFVLAVVSALSAGLMIMSDLLVW
jgi:hypothetical protein